MLERNLFHGSSIRLTELSQEDIPVITRWYHHSAFGRLFDADPSYPRSQRHWKNWFDEEDKDKDTYLFAIRPLDNERLIGIITLDGILWSNQTAWLAIGIGDTANRGRGYGAEAMQLIINFGFSELNLYRLQLSVFEYNTRAIALYERLGFVREGTYRQFLARDGRRYDMYLYGLLRDEWKHL
ncbi:MAG: GNAT family N-acetyltransferase [Anaerolineae bacterium]|nr:GNAT family N-acetyltransferase [Anaerolineae bacterium]MCA9887012.1 GNAT family N-acetyltransferase [Anaerolineae bacterium]